MTHPMRLLALCLCGFVLAPSAIAETWSDITGKFQIDAEFVGVEGTNIVLRKADGTTLQVPIAKLSEESRAQGKKLYEMQRSGGGSSTTQPAAAASATTPPPAKDLGFEPPQPPTIPPMAAFPENASLEDTVKFVLDQAIAGHPEVIWHALPAEMRDLVDSDDFRSNFTPFIEEQAATSEQIEDVVMKALKVLVTKKDFVLKSQFMSQLPPDALPMVQQGYDPAVGVIYEATSLGFSTDSLATKTMTEMVDYHGPRIGAHLQELAKLAPPGAIDQFLTSVQVAQTDDSTGTITVPDQAGGTEVTEMVRYGGRWISKELADEWETNKDSLANDLAAQLNATKEENEQNTQMVQAMIGGLADNANGILDQLLAASDQQQFDGALTEGMGAVMGAMMGGGGPGGPGGPGGFGPGGPGGDFGAPGGPPGEIGDAAPPDGF